MRLFKTRVVMDINLLPAEYKTIPLKKGIKAYEKDFGVKIIPVDSSRQNLGSSINLIHKI